MKHFPYDLLVLFNGGGEDHYIIHVDNNLSSVDQIPEEVVHHGLEGGGGVC